MPVSVQWYDEEQHIILYTFEGQWTWEELHGVLNEVSTMMGSVNHRVDAIIDLSSSRFVPSNALLKMRIESDQPSPNWGIGVFVQAGTFINALLETFKRLNRTVSQRYFIANSIDEAIEMIAKERDNAD